MLHRFVRTFTSGVLMGLAFITTTAVAGPPAPVQIPAPVLKAERSATNPRSITLTVSLPNYKGPTDIEKFVYQQWTLGRPAFLTTRDLPGGRRPSFTIETESAAFDTAFQVQAKAVTGQSGPWSEKVVVPGAKGLGDALTTPTLKATVSYQRATLEVDPAPANSEYVIDAGGDSPLETRAAMPYYPGDPCSLPGRRERSYRVARMNANVISGWSNTVVVACPCGRVSPPTNVVVKPVQNAPSSMEVSWSPASAPANCPIEAYEVELTLPKGRRPLPLTTKTSQQFEPNTALGESFKVSVRARNVLRTTSEAVELTTRRPDIMTLQSVVTGKFVAVDKSPQQRLVANVPAAALASRFERVLTGQDRFSLRALASNRWVTVETTPGPSLGELRATAVDQSAAAVFRVQTNVDLAGTSSYYTMDATKQRKVWLTADPSRGAVLRAEKNAVGPTEKFKQAQPR